MKRKIGQQRVLLNSVWAEQAKERGTKLIDEDGLFSLVAATKLPDSKGEPVQPPSAPSQPPGGSSTAPKAPPKGGSSGASTSAAARSAGTGMPGGGTSFGWWICLAWGIDLSRLLRRRQHQSGTRLALQTMLLP